MSNRFIVDRALPERAKLLFYFPMPSQGEDYYVVEVPFFENPSIKENKKARYKKYSLVSRSSNLYSYLGADSKQLTLSFNMTFPHILQEHPDITIDKYITYQLDRSNLETEKQKFLQSHKVASVPKGMAFTLGTSYTKSLAVDSARQVLNSEWARKGITVSELETLKNTYGVEKNSNLLPVELNGNFIQEDTNAPTIVLDNNAASQVKNRVIDIMIYWVNIIRSSVLNYSKNPIYGPPIIRLRHGILYQDIPCICTNYSIDFNEAAGYDLNTLLPNQLRVTMKLEEIRTGDFGEFNPNDANNPIKRDNLAGWEAVVLGETNSTDPGYGGIL